MFSQPASDSDVGYEMLAQLADYALSGFGPSVEDIEASIPEQDHERFTEIVTVKKEVGGLNFETRAYRAAALRVQQNREERRVKELVAIMEAGAGHVKTAVPGDQFILDTTNTPAIWGSGSHALWVSGEALLIAGPPGVGKTTIACQVLGALLGIGRTDVLGYPVTQAAGRVLYLAADRPKQFQRAAGRIFTEADRETLRDKLTVWQGPPPTDFAQDTDALVRLCKAHDADTVIVDSLKDVAVGLSNDEVGAGLNRARQTALTAEIEVLELHHNVKRGANGAAPTTLADVYGSTWITSGAGSVIGLHGDAGDPVVKLRHLKQPASEVGPFDVLHDHDAGLSTVAHEPNPIELARCAGPEGLTVLGAAKQLFGEARPTPGQKEKARRQLDRLATSGQLIRLDPQAKTGAATYHAPTER